jgi:hypothetical protein
VNLKSISTVAVLTITASGLAPARGLAWDFTRLTLSAEYGISEPAVSRGDIAYTYYGPGGASIGVYRVLGYEWIVGTGDPAPIGVFTVFGPARISDGTVAFRASYTGGTSIFAKSGGTLTTIATIGDVVPSTSSPIEGFGDVAISGQTIAFQASYDGGAQQGVFTGSGGPLTTIAKVGDATALGLLAQIDSNPHIGGATVAFSATLGDGATSAVFARSGGALTTICKTGDAAPVGSVDTASVVGVGTGGNVVVRLTYDGGTKSGLFTGSGGPLAAIVKTGDVVPSFGEISTVGSVSVSSDAVAFRADDGIFTGSSSAPPQLVCRIRELGGDPYALVGLGPFGLNGDRIAMTYSQICRNCGYSIGILTIPEPTLWPLVAPAVIAMAGVSRIRPSRVG